MLFAMYSCKEGNEEFITLCKATDSTIRIDYFDSAHGISDIKTIINADTLQLKVYVVFWHEQKSYDIPIERIIKYVKVGEKTFDLANVPKCPNVFSGQEAIDSIK
jgi:hypothetical protein